MTLSPSLSVILSSLRVLSGKFGLIVGWNFPSTIIPFTLRLLWESFLDFLRSLAQRFVFYRQRDFQHYIFSTFIANWMQVIIAFLSSLFMKGDWFYLTCFSFIGAWLLSTLEEMHLNFLNFPGEGIALSMMHYQDD